MRSGMKPFCSYLERHVLLDRAIGFWESVFRQQKSPRKADPNQETHLVLSSFSQVLYRQNHDITKTLLSVRPFQISLPKERLQTGNGRLSKRRASAGVQACRRARNKHKRDEKDKSQIEML